MKSLFWSFRAANLAALEKAEGLYLSKIDGVNTAVAQAQAQLEQAQFDLDSTGEVVSLIDRMGLYDLIYTKMNKKT